MKIPEEFRDLCGWFYQGSSDDFATLEEWFAFAVAHVGGDKGDLKAFLDELLSGRHTDDEIAQVWRRAGPHYDFGTGDHRVVLTEIRRMLD
jgi:hypothetical protein